MVLGIPSSDDHHQRFRLLHVVVEPLQKKKHGFWTNSAQFQLSDLHRSGTRATWKIKIYWNVADIRANWNRVCSPNFFTQFNLEVVKSSRIHQEFCKNQCYCWAKLNRTNQQMNQSLEVVKTLQKLPKINMNQPTCAALRCFSGSPHPIFRPPGSGRDRSGCRCSSTFEACPAKSELGS